MDLTSGAVVAVSNNLFLDIQQYPVQKHVCTGLEKCQTRLAFRGGVFYPPMSLWVWRRYRWGLHRIAHSPEPRFPYTYDTTFSWVDIPCHG